MDPHNDIPIIISFIGVVVGGIAGIAALLKVNSDTSSTVSSGAKSVSEGAERVVDLMMERMDEQEARLEALEEYTFHSDEWTERLIDLLDRVVTFLPAALRQQYEDETSQLKSSRPRRTRAKKAPEVSP